MSRKRQALGETRSKTLSSSQPTKYQSPTLSKSLISPPKSLPCIRKNKLISKNYLYNILKQFE